MLGVSLLTPIQIQHVHASLEHAGTHLKRHPFWPPCTNRTHQISSCVTVSPVISLATMRRLTPSGTRAMRKLDDAEGLPLFIRMLTVGQRCRYDHDGRRVRRFVAYVREQ